MRDKELISKVGMMSYMGKDGVRAHSHDPKTKKMLKKFFTKRSRKNAKERMRDEDGRE